MKQSFIKKYFSHAYHFIVLAELRPSPEFYIALFFGSSILLPLNVLVVCLFSLEISVKFLLIQSPVFMLTSIVLSVIPGFHPYLRKRLGWDSTLKLSTGDYLIGFFWLLLLGGSSFWLLLLKLLPVLLR